MTKSTLTVVLILTVLTGCSFFGNSANDQRIVVVNDAEALSQRQQIKDEAILIDTTATNGFRSKKAKKVTFDLKLESELSSPEVTGKVLQATMVSNDNSNAKWLISYNQKGDSYIGSIDFAQVSGNGKNIEVRSNVSFTDSDVNAVDLSNNILYAAIATDNTSIVNGTDRSAIQSLGINGFNIQEDENTERSLKSFAANSIHMDDDLIYVTSGSNGGLTVFDEDLSNEIAYVEIDGARWVDISDDYLAVLAGDTNNDGNGTIYLINKSNYQILAEYSFAGATKPEAKNTLEIVNDYAFIAAGDEGVQLMDLRTGTVTHNIPRPDPSSMGLSEDVVTTNAVTVDDDKIFISNGEAGVYVAELSEDADDIENDDFEITMLGKLQFGDVESVNHVTYRNKLLLVAAGLGGTKVVSLTDK